MSAIAFDLDGTICFDGRQVPAEILAALAGIPNTVSVIIASARHPVNIAQVLPAQQMEQWDVVGANGAIAMSGGMLVSEVRLDAELASTLISTFDRIGCAYLAYGVDFVIPGQHPHAMHRVIKQDIGARLRLGDSTDHRAIVKFLALPSTGCEKALKLSNALAETSVHRHSDGSFDVMAGGVDKVTGIAALGYSLPLSAAFGNDANDVEMLRQASYSIGVGNHPSVQLVATRIIPDGSEQIRRISTEITARVADMINANGPQSS
jgi:hydroxymethylpyrimidine pyrophosphatase-like HAD family hydrolase